MRMIDSEKVKGGGGNSSLHLNSLKKISVILILLCSLLEVRSIPISLEKRGEFYLKARWLEKSKKSLILNTLHLGNLFVVTPRAFILGLMGTDIYFFNKEGDYIARIEGYTGDMPGGFINTFFSINCSPPHFIVVGGSCCRINVYSEKGEFIKSFPMPRWINFLKACIIDSLLIVSGTVSKNNESIFLYNSKTGDILNKFHNIPMEKWRIIEKRGLDHFIWNHFILSPDTTLLCTRSIQYEIFEYDLSGKLVHIYNEKPSYYVSPFKLKPFDIKYMAKRLKKGYGGLNNKGKIWYSSWTHTGSPSLYNDSILLIPRSFRRETDQNNFFLDFYSLKDKKYIGYIQLDKPFLSSDSSWIYLCEEFTDTSITVGKYKMKMEKKPVESKTQYIPPGSIYPWKNKGQEKKTEMLHKVKEFELRSMDGRNVSLVNYLSRNKNHFLIFIRPLDCGVIQFYKKVKEFTNRNRNWEVLIIVNHPYKDELDFFIHGLKRDIDAPLIANLEPERITELGITCTPALLVMNIDGEIVDKFCTHSSEIPLDIFLNNLNKEQMRRHNK